MFLPNVSSVEPKLSSVYLGLKDYEMVRIEKQGRCGHTSYRGFPDGHPLDLIVEVGHVSP